MSETRSRILDCVQRNPGIHFNEITRSLDIATGQTQYHLRKLLREQTITSEAVCGRTHYYPPTFSQWERGVIALLRRETTRELVLVLLEDDQRTPAALTNRLGLARSTVEWHLSNLADFDVVTKREQTTRSGETRLVVELEDPDTIYRLLREIEPRLSDRLADRFMRLTDELLG